MPDPRTIHIKALFDQLVSAIGTQEAAAVFLGVSRQRIGQLINTSNTDLPTLIQIQKLEEVCGQSVVFAALARQVESDSAQVTAMAAAVEASQTSAATLSTVFEGAADLVWEAHEIDAAQDKARLNLEAAKRAFDATMALKPTHRVVQ
ncbi:helix-turn-helix domain-containing protein [Brevundimonas diminuta]|uniref:helix-turn-helix domain-containing protein n=1 Tax=Brevundimonas diminuta TaxID=293 RepID=UPI00320B1626